MKEAKYMSRMELSVRIRRATEFLIDYWQWLVGSAIIIGLGIFLMLIGLGSSSNISWVGIIIIFLGVFLFLLGRMKKIAAEYLLSATKTLPRQTLKR